jgi:hypothetical protein
VRSGKEVSSGKEVESGEGSGKVRKMESGEVSVSGSESWREWQ